MYSSQACRFICIEVMFSLFFYKNVHGEAMFVFGDSLVDAGNNNYIITLAKANYPPHGTDFNRSNGLPTGRFSNGRTVADVIVDELGWKVYPLPYLAPRIRYDDIFNGVNYASAGSGILNDTGSSNIGRIPLTQQVEYFSDTKRRMIRMQGIANTEELLAKALFFNVIGSNDILNIPDAVNSDSLIDFAIMTYKDQLKRLYDLGARKILVSNLGPIGCIPKRRDTQDLDNNKCARIPIENAMKFNVKLKPMVQDISNTNVDATYVYVDAYSMFLDIVINYQQYGFVSTDTACCGSLGRYRERLACSSLTYQCPNHGQYVFWDAYHPTEAANIISAHVVVYGSSDAIFPMNVQQLMQSR